MFDAIASGEVDAGAVHLLLSSERSRRLLLMQHVLTSCRTDPALLGPLRGVGAAEELLRAVQDRNPAAAETLLLDPLTGMWLASAVQIVEGAARSSARPPWVRLGGLAALAASAALRTRMTFALELPAEDRHVLLPGLGRVDLSPSRIGPEPPHWVVTVESDGNRVLIGDPGDPRCRVELPLPLPIQIPTDRPHPGWTPAPVIRERGVNGHVLRVRVDHLDPAPHGVGLPMPAELSTGDLAHWQARLVEAWQLLDADHPRDAAALAAGLGAIMPLSGTGALAGSSAEGFGAAAISLPASVADLACALIHEFMHSILNGLLHLVQLYRPEPNPRLYYAPWRDDPRPMSGMLHGAYAFSTVTGFWRTRSRSDTADAARRAQLEFAVWRLHTAAVLEALAGNPILTPLGVRMIALLQDRAAGWTSEEVEPEAARLAGIVAASHRAMWRAHHLSTAPRWLADAAEAWLAGRAAPTGASETIVTDPAAQGLNRTFILARWVHARSPGPVPSALDEARARDSTGADRLLLGGDGAGAAERYLAQIGDDPEDPHPWGGLGPALAEATSPTQGDAQSVRFLVAHPERVRALYRRLQSGPGPTPDVLELAAWLAGAY
jgi:HEXXH motif-containing protein